MSTPETLGIELRAVPGSGHEACCFCRKGTSMWTRLPTRTPAEQVACCGPCAKKHRQSDVPTKTAWFDAEAARRGAP